MTQYEDRVERQRLLIKAEKYNSGLIQRTCSDGGLVYFGKELKGDELIDSYIQNNQN